MKKWSKVFTFVLTSVFLLGAGTTAFADVSQVNMALNPDDQSLYITIKTDCDFEGFFTIEPESLVVTPYNNVINCGEFCMPDYTCMVNCTLTVVAGLNPGQHVTFRAEVFCNENPGVPIGSVEDELVVMGNLRDDLYFGYLWDCDAVVPYEVEQDEAYCLWLCHRTYVIPIVCPPELVDIPIFRIRPGCDEDLGYWDVCSVDTCGMDACEWGLSWNVVIPDTDACIAYLIVIYGVCDSGCACLKGPDWILPVEMSAFAAHTGDGFVNLMWTTASETNNHYFDVQRRTDNTNWISVGRVDGHGTVATSTDYEFTDYSVMNGVTYHYRLLSYDFNGARHEYNSIEATPGMAAPPTEYALEQNYPNPFNPQTTISYAIKDPGFVSLKVYNLIGQKVATLVSNTMETGRYTVNFTADNLPSGIYLYTLTAGEFSQTQKMLLLK